MSCKQPWLRSLRERRATRPSQLLPASLAAAMGVTRFRTLERTTAVGAVQKAVANQRVLQRKAAMIQDAVQTHTLARSFLGVKAALEQAGRRSTASPSTDVEE